jgi:hypothetical protein
MIEGHFNRNDAAFGRNVSQTVRMDTFKVS